MIRRRTLALHYAPLLIALSACGGPPVESVETEQDSLLAGCLLRVSGRLAVDSRVDSTGLRPLAGISIKADVRRNGASLADTLPVPTHVTDADGRFTISAFVPREDADAGLQVALSYRLHNAGLDVWGSEKESGPFRRTAGEHEFFDSELLSGTGSGSYGPGHILDLHHPSGQMLFNCGTYDLSSEYLIHENTTGQWGLWLWKANSDFVITDPRVPATLPEMSEDAKTSLLDLSEARADFNTWSRASIWVEAQDYIQYMATLGHRFAFEQQLRIRYPYNSILRRPGEAAFANPMNGRVSIYQCECALPDVSCTSEEAEDRCDDKPRGDWDYFSRDTIFHEMTHVWAYDKGHGEQRLLVELVRHETTHGVVSDPGVAFHEGFADFVAGELKAVLRGNSPSSAPMARTSLTRKLTEELELPSGTGAPTTLTVHASYDRAERYDDAWVSFFRILSRPDLETYDFGSVDEAELLADYVYSPPAGDSAHKDALPGVFAPTGCTTAAPALGLRAVLRVFLASTRDGIPRDIEWSDLTFDGYLNRAVSMSSGISLSRSQATLTKHLINPNRDTQPWQIMGCAL